jgi:hypothetical protein
MGYARHRVRIKPNQTKMFLRTNHNYCMTYKVTRTVTSTTATTSSCSSLGRAQRQYGQQSMAAALLQRPERRAQGCWRAARPRQGPAWLTAMRGSISGSGRVPYRASGKIIYDTWRRTTAVLKKIGRRCSRLSDPYLESYCWLRKRCFSFWPTFTRFFVNNLCIYPNFVLF